MAELAMLVDIQRTVYGQLHITAHATESSPVKNQHSNRCVMPPITTNGIAAHYVAAPTNNWTSSCIQLHHKITIQRTKLQSKMAISETDSSKITW